MSKIQKQPYESEVIYSKDHWELIEEKRKIAEYILSSLQTLQVDSILYGSTARGDVSTSSDIDIVLLKQTQSFLIEQSIEKLNEQIIDRRIVMATPGHAIKGQYELTNEITISFPLVDFSEREIEFYHFGGFINYKQLKEGVRVPGVNKELILIEPIAEGHIEKSILHIPKKYLIDLGLPQRIINERIRVLRRRDNVGRTGVFLNQRVDPAIGFGLTLKQLADTNPIVRRKYRE